LKRLLIHIGYPKTATTSLQEGLFLKLHNLGKINYLGRTVTSTHSHTGTSRFSGVDIVIQLRKYFLFGTPFSTESIKLSTSKLNVISDEDLTLHKFFHQAQFGIDRNPIDFGKVLIELFKDADKIEVLMTIRNQSDLIFSCFIQKYRFIASSFQGFGFSNFIKNEKGFFNEDTADCFDFNKVASVYENLIQGPVNILMFEDLLNDKSYFSARMASILNLDNEIVDPLIQDAHFRRKESFIKNNQLIAEKSFGLGRFLKFLLGEKKFNLFFSKFWYSKYSIPSNILRKLLFKKYRIDVPEFSPGDKQFIFDYFKERNKTFCIKYGLCLNNMKKYNYI
jgi:hypothetical protein